MLGLPRTQGAQGRFGSPHARKYVKGRHHWSRVDARQAR
jgi:hypothetical protein